MSLADIDRILAAIHNMQKPLEEKNQEEKIIRDGYVYRSSSALSSVLLNFVLDH